MVLPIDYLEAARTLRRHAAAPGELVDRARMIILAERFEQLAKDLETELAARARN